jgi:hypothetical protein
MGASPRFFGDAASNWRKPDAHPLLFELHSILRLACVLYYDFQIVLAVDALSISTGRPHWTIHKYVPLLTQSARAVCFQLITNRLRDVPPSPKSLKRVSSSSTCSRG